MSLPAPETLLDPVTCWPAWYPRVAKYNGRDASTVVGSGCATVGGNVQCRPADMAAAAARRTGLPITLEVYTLARYMASEVGSGNATEKIAVAQAAVNRARLEGISINKLLLYRQASTHPNYGYYGPINVRVDGELTAPYGRWAATSRDPTLGELVLALGVMDGTFDGFNKGADDQDGPEYFKDPVGYVRREGAKGKYWVGPLPGVDHWHTFQLRTLRGVAPSSELGRALIARGVAALSSKARPSWDALPVCSGDSVTSRIARLPSSIAATAIGIGSVFLGMLAFGLTLRARQARIAPRR